MTLSACTGAILCQETTYPLCHNNRVLPLAGVPVRSVNATE